MVSDVDEYFYPAVKKWKLYDNKACHEIQALVKLTNYNNSNFYEFAKGYVFSSIESRDKIKSLEAQLAELKARQCDCEECKSES